MNERAIDRFYDEGEHNAARTSGCRLHVPTGTRRRRVHPAVRVPLGPRWPRDVDLHLLWVPDPRDGTGEPRPRVQRPAASARYASSATWNIGAARPARRSSCWPGRAARVGASEPVLTKVRTPRPSHGNAQVVTGSATRRRFRRARHCSLRVSSLTLRSRRRPRRGSRRRPMHRVDANRRPGALARRGAASRARSRRQRSGRRHPPRPRRSAPVRLLRDHGPQPVTPPRAQTHRRRAPSSPDRGDGVEGRRAGTSRAPRSGRAPDGRSRSARAPRRSRRAGKVIKAAGYRYADKAPPAALDDEAHHHLPSLVRADGTIAIELHHKLGSSGSPPDFDVTGVWAVRCPSMPVTRRVFGRPTRTCWSTSACTSWSIECGCSADGLSARSATSGQYRRLLGHPRVGQVDRRGRRATVRRGLGGGAGHRGDDRRRACPTTCSQTSHRVDVAPDAAELGRRRVFRDPAWTCARTTHVAPTIGAASPPPNPTRWSPDDAGTAPPRALAEGYTEWVRLQQPDPAPPR